MEARNWFSKSTMTRHPLSSKCVISKMLVQPCSKQTSYSMILNLITGWRRNSGWVEMKKIPLRPNFASRFPMNRTKSWSGMARKTSSLMRSRMMRVSSDKYVSSLTSFVRLSDSFSVISQTVHWITMPRVRTLSQKTINIMNRSSKLLRNLTLLSRR